MPKTVDKSRPIEKTNIYEKIKFNDVPLGSEHNGFRGMQEKK